MQFGLDARGDAALDVAFLVSSENNPRKRLEAKSYRARDRADNGWFRHDSTSPFTTPDSTPVKTAHNQENCCRCGGQVRMPSVTPKSASRVEGRRNRDRILGYDHPAEWYGTPLKEEPVVNRSSHKDSVVFKNREFNPNSKDWYRHEHTLISANDDEIENRSGRSTGKVDCISSPFWWSPAVIDGTGVVKQSPRPRLLGPDAEKYWQRDHAGSTNEWFPHEHAVESSIDAKEEVNCPDQPEDFPDVVESAEALEGGQKAVCCHCMHTATSNKNAGLDQPDSTARRSRQTLAEKFLQLQ